MPKKQIKTNTPLLQNNFEGKNTRQKSGNNYVAGNNNNVFYENNIVAGDRNSAAGQTIVLGNHNLVGNPSRVQVIGSDNVVLSSEGVVMGASNSILTPQKNFFLFGVDGLSMTQSVSNVWIFGNPIGTFSVGTQSFPNVITAPTQSGIYLNQPVYLGPNVNIFNNNGLPISGGSQNLNQVLTVGNTTGGQDIVMSSGDLIKGSGQSNIDLNYAGGILIRPDSTLGCYITMDSATNTVDVLSDFQVNIGGLQNNFKIRPLPTVQTIGFTTAGYTSNLGNNELRNFIVYVKGKNVPFTLGYYGELRVTVRSDGAGNITQIGVDDLYEVSDFTTVTLSSVYPTATQITFEVTGEAGETINFDFKYVDL